jgi:hypothetical protein
MCRRFLAIDIAGTTTAEQALRVIQCARIGKNFSNLLGGRETDHSRKLEHPTALGSMSYKLFGVSILAGGCDSTRIPQFPPTREREANLP